MVNFRLSFLGRRLTVSKETKLNTVYNFPVQATGSDGFKLALTGINATLQGVDGRLIHSIHDEVIIEAETEIAADLMGVVKSCMEGAFKTFFPDVPFKVEPLIKDTWG